MRIAVISVTERGRKLSQKISEQLSVQHTIRRFCFAGHSDDNAAEFRNISILVHEIFSRSDGLVFICACGIAVRAIAPYIRNKADDPAVLVIDDRGDHVIPLLSGHLGGANRLSEIIAEIIDAEAIITTATDSAGLFSPDSFAAANDLIIEDLTAAKKIASAILDGENTGLISSYPCKNIPACISENNNCRTGIIIGAENIKSPFEVTLRLIPKNIVIGIGCKSGVSGQAIGSHVLKSLSEADISIERVCAVSTIDLKKNERGLLEFCHKYNIPLIAYTARELMSVSGDFSSSDFVRKTVGADNVCERSAVLCSGGHLVMRKKASDGVTVAAAEKCITPDLERKIL